MQVCDRGIRQLTGAGSRAATVSAYTWAVGQGKDLGKEQETYGRSSSSSYECSQQNEEHRLELHRGECTG